MRAYHDSRDIRCREPYGALELGDTVALAIDVWDAPGASVVLRTWVDGKGECRLPMEAVSPTRHVIVFEPLEPGITWYYFIITSAEGETKLYGAKEGRRGGVGRLWDWEPPSFQLTVCDPKAETVLEETEIAAIGCTFEDTFVRFLHDEVPAFGFIEALETLRENCHACEWSHMLDLIGRADPAVLLERLGDGNVGLAKARLWCVALIQRFYRDARSFALPTDEANQRGQSLLVRWAAVDKDCEDIVRNAAELRAALPVFDRVAPKLVAVTDDVLAVYADDGNGEAACVLVNTSLQNAYDVPVPVVGEAISEVLGGYSLPIVDADETLIVPAAFSGAERYALVHLYQVGTAVLYAHSAAQLACSMEPGLGVLAHITSLPADEPGQPGVIGPMARRFVDWLADAGVKYWQILPLNPTDEHGSPYAGISAFAGNCNLIPAENDDDLLSDSDKYKAFCKREADWLDPYAYFMAIREKVGADAAWRDWPKKYRHFDLEAFEDKPKLRKAAERQRRAQFAFEQQWKALRAYANERGVKIVGDMPIYVSADSADVWANPDLFQLGSDGAPEVVAGCPPDAFAAEGQVWGNPVYDWDAVRASGYAWWLRRLERAFDLYDVVRLDHFIGFARYFSIPAGQKAASGSYRPGPGLELFQAAYGKFGPLPIIAEDLGSITPCVRALVATCGFPGMDIVQFVDGGDPLSGYWPRPCKIVYTGTHDNQTLAGYCETRYPDLDVKEAVHDLMETALTSAAPMCVVPLQDVLGLGDEARMNVPGTTEGNWTWQADAAALADASDELRRLVLLHDSATSD